VVRELGGIDPEQLGDWIQDEELGLEEGTIERLSLEVSEEGMWADLVAVELLKQKGYDGAIQVPPEKDSTLAEIMYVGE
jgi:hypothetical protein